MISAFHLGGGGSKKHIVAWRSYLNPCLTDLGRKQLQPVSLISFNMHKNIHIAKHLEEEKVTKIHQPHPPSLCPSEHVGWCNIRALGGSCIGVPAHHHRLHVLLPALFCVWEAARGPSLPRQSGSAAEKGKRPVASGSVRLWALCSWKEANILPDMFGMLTFANEHCRVYGLCQ